MEFDSKKMAGDIAYATDREVDFGNMESTENYLKDYTLPKEVPNRA